jgi:hypothetical protein
MLGNYLTSYRHWHKAMLRTIYGWLMGFVNCAVGKHGSGDYTLRLEFLKLVIYVIVTCLLLKPSKYFSVTSHTKASSRRVHESLMWLMWLWIMASLQQSDWVVALRKAVAKYCVCRCRLFWYYRFQTLVDIMFKKNMINERGTYRHNRNVCSCKVFD